MRFLQKDERQKLSDCIYKRFDKSFYKDVKMAIFNG